MCNFLTNPHNWDERDLVFIRVYHPAFRDLHPSFSLSKVRQCKKCKRLEVYVETSISKGWIDLPKEIREEFEKYFNGEKLVEQMRKEIRPTISEICSNEKTETEKNE